MGAFEDQVLAQMGQQVQPGISLGQDFAPTQAPQQAGQDLNYLEGFGKSSLWSIGELFGAKAPQDVENWRANYPISGFTSEMAGFAVPYAGWARAARAIKPLENAVRSVGGAANAAKHPFLTPAKQELIRFAPFEAGRVAIGTMGGEELSNAFGGAGERGFGDLALEAGLNLGLGAGLVGTVGTLGSAGQKALARRTGKPGVDESQVRQVQLRQLKANVADGTADPQIAARGMQRLREEIFNESPLKGINFVDNLVDAPHESARQLNRLFRTSRGANLDKLKFGRAVKDKEFFLEGDGFDRVLPESGLDGLEEFVQFPRFIRTKTKGKTKQIRRVLAQGLKSVDGTNGWSMKQDADDGLYVMSKRIKPNEWVLFKTDRPDAFLPEHAKYARATENRINSVYGRTQQKFEPLSTDPNAPTGVFDSLANYKNTVPMMDLRGVKEPLGSAAKVTSFVAEKTGLNKLADSELVEGGKRFVHDFLAPGMFQFKESPIASHIFGAARLARETANATAERMFLGGRVLGEKGNLFTAISKGAAPKVGAQNINTLVDEVAKNSSQWDKFQQAVIRGLTPDEAVAEMGLDDAAAALMREMDRVDKLQIAGKQAIQNRFGLSEFQPLENHYMMSRTWEGDWRVPIFDRNQLVGYASGETRKAALNQADGIMEQAARDGLSWRSRSPQLADTVEQELKLLSGLTKDDARFFGQIRSKSMLREGAPKRLTEAREGARFFVGDKDRWTPDFVKKQVLKQLGDYQTHNAKLSLMHMFEKDFDQLREIDPQIADTLLKRVGDVFGEQGPVTKTINQAADKVLAPVLGKNSASKIVNATNKALFRLSFGFANTGFNLANLMTFVQTAFPHMAYLTSAAPTRLMKEYTYWPMVGDGGKVAGMGALDPLKIAAKSFRQMGNPDASLRKLFERSAAEGVTDPKFIEEFVGQQSAKARNLRGALSAEGGFSDWIGAVADFVPSQSEKFARGHAFVLGHTFFKDILGVQDQELLYQLSKQFVEKTQYMYSTADRPAIMGGPMGGTFGLFKNWITHYMAQMLQYTGEGFMRGNWSPLLWQLGGTTAIGGIGALPFYGAANAYSEWASDKSILANTFDAFAGTPLESGKESIGAADVIFYGLPAFGNFSLQGQTSAPGADFAEDASRYMQLAVLDRAKILGKALGSANDFVGTTGMNPIQDEDTRNLFMRALAPKSIYRAAQAIQGAADNGQLKSLTTGQTQLELSPAELVMHGLSLNPRKAEVQFEIARELWRDQDKMKQAVANFGDEWADAIQAGDNAALNNLIQRAMAQNVDLSRVIKSGKTRLQRSFQDQIDAQFSPEATLPWAMRGLR
jgi:hypothetical protein